ncbi:YitT family protein [Clostridium folliculivorans]|uniref:Membrane protein n=1 Tax=Clostridium folliculivorans TaxID=2886038 RepID=A0A9W6DDK0_9CLOT|nr:YitT family protein [Clostridium folliculivorans]GKU27812.1 membrane protein [Clostridium folliculivorans]GKU31829.1 membrane protein [Clostridium folliculivorans]
MDYIKTRKSYIFDILIIIAGCFISSLGINLFLTHAKLLSGGATGVALIIQYLKGFNAGFSVFLINLPLFIVSYIKLDKKFTMYSALGMVSLSVSLIVTSPFSKIIVLDDILLYCIYGGVLCGIGYGLVFSRNGSTGGTDIITMLIRKKYSNFNIGKLGFTLNLVIVAVGAFFFGIPKALYTLISMFIQSYVLDVMVRGLSRKNLLLILTEREEDVINYIINDLHRGVTSLFAEGEYTHDRKKMLYCIVTTRQMIELKNTIHLVDPKAFLTIIDISEVRGKGFKNI